MAFKNANQWAMPAMLYLTSKAEQLVYLPMFFQQKKSTTPHFMGNFRDFLGKS